MLVPDVYKAALLNAHTRLHIIPEGALSSSPQFTEEVTCSDFFGATQSGDQENVTLAPTRAPCPMPTALRSSCWKGLTFTTGCPRQQVTLGA